MADIVQGLRAAIQDLLVPELKAIQVELKHQGEAITTLQSELKELRKEMHERFEAVHKEMNERFEGVMKEIAELKVGQMDLKAGQREILAKLDVDKRITKLETLVEQLLKKVA